VVSVALVLPAGTRTLLQTVLIPEGTSAAFRICSSSADATAPADWTIHATAALEPSPSRTVRTTQLAPRDPIHAVGGR